MTRGRRRQVFASDLCFRGAWKTPRKRSWSPGVISKVAPGSPSQRAVARASFRLGQIDEVQAETSARLFRDGTYGPALCLCPASEVEDHRPTDAKHLVRGPQQAAFEDVSLAVGVGFTPHRSEEGQMASHLFAAHDGVERGVRWTLP
jgi:hypothetical protein